MLHRRCPSCHMRGIVFENAAPFVFYCRYCKWSVNLEVDSEETKAALKLLAKANVDRPVSTYISLSVTTEAWIWITQTAGRLGYLQSRLSLNAYGISRFICDLASYEFEDAREDFLLETDQWYSCTDMPINHLVHMPEKVRETYLQIANEFGIAPYSLQQAVVNGYYARIPKHVLIANEFYYGSPARIGPVLEAIGLRWLSVKVDKLRPIEVVTTVNPRSQAQARWRARKRSGLV